MVLDKQKTAANDCILQYFGLYADGRRKQKSKIKIRPYQFCLYAPVTFL